MRIKESMEKILSFAEAYDDLQEAEVTVVLNRSMGEKSLFIRMQSLVDVNGKICRNSSYEDLVSKDWF